MFSGEILYFHTVVPFSEIPDEQIQYSVVAARHQQQWVCVRLKSLSTWCFPGGRREEGETIEENARRELFEETGALEYSLTPLGLYGVDHRQPSPPHRHIRYTWGGFYAAEIHKFGSIPEEFEIAERRLFPEFPLHAARFPQIMPGMMEYLNKQSFPF